MHAQRDGKRVGRLLGLGIAAVLGLLILAACYSYVPMVGEDPTPSDDVRVRLSQAEAVRMSERTGRTIRSLEGSVLRVPADSLVLDVGWGAVYAGTVFEGRRDTLSFHRRDLLEVDRREFSRRRTALVGAGVVALVVAAWAGISGGGDITDEPGNDDPVF